jgi:hypothetical protein
MTTRSDFTDNQDTSDDTAAELPPAPWTAPIPERPTAVRVHTPQPLDPDAPIVTRRRRTRGDPFLALVGGVRERSVTSDADLIAPSSVDRGPVEYVRSGQSLVRSFAVLQLPRQLRPGALVGLMHMPGVQVTLVNNPFSRAATKERLAQKARQMGVSLSQAGDEGADEAQAMQDIRRVLGAITDETSTLHLVGLYLTVAGADLHELNERTRRLRAACTDAQIQIVACDAQHWEGLLTTAPLGHDLLRYLFETDTPTLARLLPSSSATLQSGQGVPILYGVRAEGSGAGQVSGAPVLLDRFALPSPHQATIAATGGGKTYQQSFALLQRFAHGNCDICVLDPKDQEYRRLARRVLGGTYLVLSDQAEVQLNPLTLPWGDPTSVERLNVPSRSICAPGAPRWSSNWWRVRRWPAGCRSAARRGPVGGSHPGVLRPARHYRRPGDVSSGRPGSPHGCGLSGRPRPRSGAVRGAGVVHAGLLGRLLHGPRPLPLAIPPSSLRPDVGVLGVDLSTFVQGQDQTLQRVIPALIADYFMTVAMRGTERKMELIIDEAWAVLNTAAGAQTIEMLARLGRSLGVAVTVITQQIREFLFRRVGRPAGAERGGSHISGQLRDDPVAAPAAPCPRRCAGRREPDSAGGAQAGADARRDQLALALSSR